MRKIQRYDFIEIDGNDYLIKDVTSPEDGGGIYYTLSLQYCIKPEKLVFLGEHVFPEVKVAGRKVECSGKTYAQWAIAAAPEEPARG